METSVYIGFTTLFAVLICLEILISSREMRQLYNAGDAMANIAIAIASALLNLSVRGFVLYFFYGIYIRNNVVDSFHPVLYWCSLFLLADFIAYWFHFLGHKSRFFWASHVIHHSSVHYNFTTAIRVPLTNFFYRFIFYAPLCMVGYDPLDILFMETCIYLYNFYLHTQLIGNLGILEWFLNTPSHHRVHHGSNDEYIDKNFGGILIIWDRLFGTFQKEEAPVMYGLRKPFQSTNPWTIISHEWFDIAAELRQVTGFGTKIKLLFGAPPDTQQSNRWALVTGGSRGIGRKIVQELAGRGFNLVVVALPDADINTVENEIRLNYSVEILAIPIDLTREGATEYIFQTCVDKGIAINILVNNAGLGNHEYFDLTEYDYMDNMMKLNNLGMVRLIYLFLPQLKASRDACIMNVGSMASLSPVPCKAVYSATKSFVYSFSKSLREELGIFGISVSCLLPGGTHTGDNRRIDAIPVKPGLFIQSAEKVAHTAVRQMFRRRFRIIPGYHNHVIYYLWRVMPPVVFKWILRRMFLRKRAQTQLAVI